MTRTRISLPLTRNEVSLPDISSIETSRQAFGDSFLKAGYILSQYLEQIELAVTDDEDFTSDPFNLIALGLFSKLRYHYYSSVLLEVHKDPLGSQFLIEQLTETAITLTYLLEEVDEDVFSTYVAASVHQAHHLLADVEGKLQVYSGHPGLLELRDKLESCIAQLRKYSASPTTTSSKVYSWGVPEADTTAKRGAIAGLGFLTDPSRSVVLSTVPASSLDLQVNYLSSAAGSFQRKAKPSTNFTSLRDTAHLCLHTTRAFLEEVINNCQDEKICYIEGLIKGLEVLFQWFYQAHNTYKRHFSVEAA